MAYKSSLNITAKMIFTQSEFQNCIPYADNSQYSENASFTLRFFTLTLE